MTVITDFQAAGVEIFDGFEDAIITGCTYTFDAPPTLSADGTKVDNSQTTTVRIASPELAGNSYDGGQEKVTSATVYILAQELQPDRPKVNDKIAIPSHGEFQVTKPDQIPQSSSKATDVLYVLEIKQ